MTRKLGSMIKKKTNKATTNMKRITSTISITTRKKSTKLFTQRNLYCQKRLIWNSNNRLNVLLKRFSSFKFSDSSGLKQHKQWWWETVSTKLVNSTWWELMLTRRNSLMQTKRKRKGSSSKMSTPHFKESIRWTITPITFKILCTQGTLEYSTPKTIWLIRRMRFNMNITLTSRKWFRFRRPNKMLRNLEWECTRFVKLSRRTANNLIFSKQSRPTHSKSLKTEKWILQIRRYCLSLSLKVETFILLKRCPTLNTTYWCKTISTQWDTRSGFTSR